MYISLMLACGHNTANILVENSLLFFRVLETRIGVKEQIEVIQFLFDISVYNEWFGIKLQATSQNSEVTLENNYLICL